MKRITLSFLTLALAVSVGNAHLYAQRGQGQGRGPTQVPGPAAGNSSQGRGAGQSQAQPRQDGNARGDAKAPWTLEQSPKVVSKLTPLLPPNTNLTAASQGFQNQGQFIAALHVSKNLNIPFSDLKARMTGSNPVSMGDAIHALRPELNDAQVKTEREKAEKQAKDFEKEL